MQLNTINSVLKHVKIITKKPISAVMPFYTIGDEIANSILHGIGALAAIAGLVLLNLKNSGVLGGHKAADMDIVSAILFAATMIGMFLISTLYHAIQLQSVKHIFRKLDHSVIFIFIAGTYTPICLSGLRGAWGWSLFAVEWALAFTGIILNVLNSKTLKKIEITVYIMMGWAIIIGFVPLIHRVPAISVIMLLAGGAAYTLGAAIYRKKSIKHTHVIWHTFVIIGAVCHWFSIWYLD
jgi:hemolysin III